MTIAAEISDDVGAVVRRVLVAQYGRLRGGTKILAQHAKSSPRTAENWLEGHCTPNAEKLVHVMRHCRELREAIFAMTSEETSHDKAALHAGNGSVLAPVVGPDPQLLHPR